MGISKLQQSFAGEPFFVSFVLWWFVLVSFVLCILLYALLEVRKSTEMPTLTALPLPTINSHIIFVEVRIFHPRGRQPC